MTSPFPAYVINLDRDTERLKSFNTYATRAGLAVTRIPGVLGANLDAASDVKHYFSEPGSTDISPRVLQKLRPGEIGNYASHLRVMQRIARDSNHPGAVVFEDDAKLEPSLVQILQNLSQSLPLDWDLVRLSNPPKRATIAKINLGAADLVQFSKIPNGAAAYMISKRGAEKFLVPRLRTLAFDEDLRRPWLFDLNVYGVMPVPVDLYSTPSSIDALGQRQPRHPLLRRIKLPADSAFTALQRLRFNVASLGLRDWITCVAANTAHTIGRHVIPDGRQRSALMLDRRTRVGA
jgi:glycosyl transferase, family 25